MTDSRRLPTVLLAVGNMLVGLSAAFGMLAVFVLPRENVQDARVQVVHDLRRFAS